jgi:hypothetical protein
MGFSLGCASKCENSFVMARENTFFEKLIKVTMRDLVHAMAHYYGLAEPLCTEDLKPWLAELHRRVDQCDRVLRMIDTNEKCTGILVELPDDLADGEMMKILKDRTENLFIFQSINHLLTEAFYWNAHKAIDITNGKGKSFRGRKLPQLSSSFRPGGVANVRNHLIEHPFELNLGYGYHEKDWWCGPRLNGGFGRDAQNNEIKDPGLFMNANEWACELTKKLQRAIDVLQANDTAQI